MFYAFYGRTNSIPVASPRWHSMQCDKNEQVLMVIGGAPE